MPSVVSCGRIVRTFTRSRDIAEVSIGKSRDLLHSKREALFGKDRHELASEKVGVLGTDLHNDNLKSGLCLQLAESRPTASGRSVR
jgi:hypothetical protein